MIYANCGSVDAALDNVVQQGVVCELPKSSSKFKAAAVAVNWFSSLRRPTKKKKPQLKHSASVVNIDAFNALRVGFPIS